MLKYWMVLAFCSPVLAVPPDLGGLSPLGAQRGVETGIGLYGGNLDYDAKVLTPIRGTFEVQVPASRPAGAVNPLLIKANIDADMPNGIYPISVYTSGGISNRMLFSVGDWPTLGENEAAPNDSTATAQPITPPIVVGGTLTAADRDFYTFTGKAGQRLVLEVESGRLNMAVDSAIELLDARGRQLQASDDAVGLGTDSRIDAVLPEDGEYFVVVHDAKFGAPAPNQYRLKIGQTIYAQGVFPLGGPREGDFAVELVGGNLEKPMEGKRLPMGSPYAPWTLVAFRPGESAALPMRFAVSDGREVLEPDGGGAVLLEPGTVLNGRISRAGEIDLFALAVSPGQRWMFEVEAAALGSSQLDGVLSVFDENNKRLAVADDGSGVVNMTLKDAMGNPIPVGGFSGLDPKLAFDIPAGVRRVFLSVEDLHGRGGPEFGYRLTARIREPNFSLRILEDRANIPREGAAVVRVAVDRVEYGGPIQLRVLHPVDGMTAEGGTIEEMVNEGVLTLSASNDATLRNFELAIVGSAGPAAQPWERRAMAMSTPSPNSPQIDLPAAIIPRLPVSITPKERRITLAHGQTLQVPIMVRRDEDANEAIGIKVRNTTHRYPQDGVQIAITGQVAEKATEAMLTFAVPGDDPQVALKTYNYVLAGNIKGVEVVIPPITVEMVRPISARILTQPGPIHPGDPGRLVGIVDRVPPFAGEVKVRIDGLPATVKAEPVLVPANESVFQFTIVTDPQIDLGVVKGSVTASIPMVGRRTTADYELPGLEMQLEIVARPPVTQPATAPATTTAPPAAQ